MALFETAGDGDTGAALSFVLQRHVVGPTHEDLPVGCRLRLLMTILRTQEIYDITKYKNKS